jgi:thymidylate kinase
MDTANEKKWFLLASTIVGALAVNFVVEKVNKIRKRNDKQQSKDERDQITDRGELPNNVPKPVQEKQSIHDPMKIVKQYNTSFRPQNVFKICVTGGPCAGKTTAMAQIQEKLREMGIRVYVVPEAATLVYNGGGFIDAGKMDTHQSIKLHSVLIRYIMDMEDHFVNLAVLNDNPDDIAVVLCDRGAMDPSAYMKKEEWQALLDEHGWNCVNLRDKRYDGVIHMVTAADGAEEHYTQENNKARYENTLEKAKEQDQKLRDAWVGHPQFVIVHNKDCPKFEDKIRKVYTTVLHMIGRPQEAPKFYKKYLLEKDPTSPIPKLPEDPTLRIECFTMDDTYLECSSQRIEEKIRRRGQKDSFSYTQSVTLYNYDFVNASQYINDGIETKKQITAREYLFLMERKDKSRVTLEKWRQCFLWEGQHYFIDTFLNVGGGFSLLMIEKNIDVKNLNLPPFIKIKKDVTDLRNASSFELAKVTNKHMDLFKQLS